MACTARRKYSATASPAAKLLGQYIRQKAKASEVEPEAQAESKNSERSAPVQ